MQIRTLGAGCKWSAPFLLVLLLHGFAWSDQAPSLVSPGNGASFSLSDSVNGRVSLGWTDVVGAIRYDVSVDGPPGFVDTLPDPLSSSVLFNCTSIPGRYDWEVRAESSENQWGPFSDSRHFFVTGYVLPTSTNTPTVTPTPTTAGDKDKNGEVDENDLFILAALWSQGSPDGDLNDDGIRNAQDILIFITEWHY